MDNFKQTILNISERISMFKEQAATEEATKTSFVLPVIAALGYNIFDPSIVVPEMDCALVKGSGEKIDYAIMKDGKPIMLIECKHWKKSLSLHETQLQKYFAASNARFGVLTNGIEYRFYTDLDKTNIMDEKPFLVLDMLNISDNDIAHLEKFHSSRFNENEILNEATQLQILTSLYDVVSRDFKEPSQTFVQYFVKAVNDGHFTSKQVTQYTPLVKKAIGTYINDVIADRLEAAGKQVNEQEETLPVEQKEDTPKVVTTQEELDAYNIVRSILRKNIDVSRIGYTDYQSYFAIQLDTNMWYWICRLEFGVRKKKITVPSAEYKGKESFDIETIDDIFKYSDKLISSLSLAMDSFNQ
jgi:hypothetical protein